MSKIDSSLLEIDAKAECEKIEKYIRELFSSLKAEYIIIGLSGGIDSAVLASLAVRAAGARNVTAYYLYDRDSSSQSKLNAELIAGLLGIKLLINNIAPAMEEKKIYSSVPMKMTTVSGFINLFLNLLFGRSRGFIYSLDKDSWKKNKIRRFIYDKTVGPIDAAFNARHIYRRQFLEHQAEKRNCIILGAANRSELLTGWFVKDGIDDMPYSPLKGLYKTQIFQLAEYLKLPSQIISQSPSPDMMKGITDESALGIKYRTLDVILKLLEDGLSDEQMISIGLRKKDVRFVRRLNTLSEWKRAVKNM